MAISMQGPDAVMNLWTVYSWQLDHGLKSTYCLKKVDISALTPIVLSSDHEIPKMGNAYPWSHGENILWPKIKFKINVT
jgi:hypothetical protein